MNIGKNKGKGVLARRYKRALRAGLRWYDSSEDEILRTIGRRLRNHRRVMRKKDWFTMVQWKSERTIPLLRWSRKVPTLTRRAFKQADSGDLAGAIRTLDELRGVGPRVASAILMFYNPRRFTVMDVRAWNSLSRLHQITNPRFGYTTARDYAKYNAACRRLSREFGHSLRDTDRALWGWDDLLDSQ